MNLGIILIDGAANHTFNTTKRKCNWHVYYIKKVQNIVFKVVARVSEAIKLHFTGGLKGKRRESHPQPRYDSPNIMEYCLEILPTTFGNY